MLRKANGKASSTSHGNGSLALLEDGVNESGAGRGSRAKAEEGALRRLSEEILRLVEASRQGRLEERGNAAQFQGAYAEIVRRH